jgi:hypothetical protein
VTLPAGPGQVYLIDTSAHASSQHELIRNVIDLLTAAVAEHHGAVMLHYDADFEHIAATTGQSHAWMRWIREFTSLSRSKREVDARIHPRFRG